MPPLPPKPQQQQRQLQQAAAAKKRALLNATKQKKKEKETPAAKPKPPPSTSTSTSASSSSTSAPKILLFPAPLATRLQGAHKPLGLVLGSSLLLQASVDLYQSTGTTISSSSPSAAAAASAAATALSASSSSSAASSALLPLPGTAALTGAALGLLYACVLLPLASRTAWASPEEPLSVVVTGGSRGLGKAMAREHLLAGDSVVVASRDWQGLVKSARELSEETGADLRLVGGGGGGDEDEEEKVEEKEASSSSSSSSFSPPPLPSHRSRPPTITPIACDVSNPASVTSLVAASLRAFEGKGKKIKIDCFYNNAGESGSFRNFADSDPRTLSRVVSTNMLGAVLCTRAVMDAMKEEGEEAGGGGGGGGGGSSGHIFFVEGAGSDGLATPGYAAYGATKAATAQLVRSLAAEEAATASSSKKNKKPSSSPPSPSPLPSSPSSKASSSSSSSSSLSPRLGFHALSPGLVLTSLLLDGVFVVPEEQTDRPSLESKMRAWAFDSLCEHPETAAAFLVPRARSLVAVGDLSSPVRYLTPLRAVLRLLSAPFRRGRHFDGETARPRWEPQDNERIFGEKNKKKSQRERERAARRGGSLAVSFATSAAALFAVLVTSGGGGGGV